MRFNIWNSPKIPLPGVLSFVVDNRGKTVPTSKSGHILIATNCVRNENLYPSYEKIRYLSEDTYQNWFRAHPVPGDILFVCKGTPGRTCMVPDPVDFCIAQDMVALRVNPQIVYNKYLLVVLRSKRIQKQIEQTSVGDVIPHFKKSFFDQILIPVPPMHIQQIIGDFYFAFSKKVELNKEINNNLEQQVSVIFQSWFENFELTNGIFPENWHYQELSTIADIESGKRPPVKSEICNQETPISIVGAASVMGFTSKANHTNKILVTGRVGTHGVIQRFSTPCWTSDNTLVITSPYYEFTNQILHRIDYSSMNRGSTQPLITQGDMKKVVVLVPDDETLVKFEKFAGSLMSKWEANNKENVKLASLRDTLLPKLMSGELDVSDIDL